LNNKAFKPQNNRKTNAERQTIGV